MNKTCSTSSLSTLSHHICQQLRTIWCCMIDILFKGSKCEALTLSWKKLDFCQKKLNRIKVNVERWNQRANNVNTETGECIFRTNDLFFILIRVLLKLIWVWRILLCQWTPWEAYKVSTVAHAIVKNFRAQSVHINVFASNYLEQNPPNSWY